MKTDIGFPNMKTLKEALKIYHGLNDKTKIQNCYDTRKKQIQMY